MCLKMKLVFSEDEYFRVNGKFCQSFLLTLLFLGGCVCISIVNGELSVNYSLLQLM